MAARRSRISSLAGTDALPRPTGRIANRSSAAQPCAARTAPRYPRRTTASHWRRSTSRGSCAGDAARCFVQLLQSGQKAGFKADLRGAVVVGMARLPIRQNHHARAQFANLSRPGSCGRRSCFPGVRRANAGCRATPTHLAARPHLPIFKRISGVPRLPMSPAVKSSTPVR